MKSAQTASPSRPDPMNSCPLPAKTGSLSAGYRPSALGFCTLLLYVLFAIGQASIAAEGDAVAPPPPAASAASQISEPLLWLRAADALTLDPHATRDRFTVSLLRQVYESLVRRGPDGKLEPGLATSWQPTSNGLTWRIELRPDVKFHDGGDFTARDVVFSLMRARGQGTAYASLLSDVTAIQAESDLVVTVTTQYSDPLMPLRLSAIAIVDAQWVIANHLIHVASLRTPGSHGYGRASSETLPNGTGPYRMTQRNVGTRTRLEANANWWARAAGDTDLEPVIEFRPISSAPARMAAFQSGKRVFLQDIPVKARGELKAQPNISVRAGTDNRVVFLGLRTVRTTASASDNAASPGAYAMTRAAIAKAIDRIGLRMNTLANQGLTTSVLIPSGFDGYSRALDKIIPPDITGAKADLKEAGIDPQGQPLTLTCPRQGHPDPVAVCTKLAHDMKLLGLPITTVFIDRSVYYRQLLNRQVDAFLFSLYDPTFDGADLLANLVRPAARWNAVALDEPAISAGVDALTASTDRRTRKLQFTIVETQLRKGNVIVPLFVPTLSYAFKGGIQMPIDALDAPELARLRSQSATPDTAANTSPNGTVQ